MINKRTWLEFDFFTFLLTLALVGIGVAAIAGATIEEDRAGMLEWSAGSGSLFSRAEFLKDLWFRQVAWVIIGLVCLFAMLPLEYTFWIRHAWIIYIVGLLSLVACYTSFFGYQSHGAYSWVKIKGIPLQFQTSEFAKITTILMLAKKLSLQKEEWHGLLDVIKPLLIGAIPAVLILKQPDLGTALVFVPMTLIMMFIAGLPYSYLLVMISPGFGLLGVSHDILHILCYLAILSGLLLLVILKKVPWTIWIPFLSLGILTYVGVFKYGEKIWEKLPEHQKGRIVGYYNPDFDPNKTNYNINQSKIALGSGGFWGKGFGKGTQSKFQFLPEFQHDFVFPVIGEQKGFLGSAVVLSLFLFLFLRGLDTALGTRSLQGTLLAGGIVSLFFSHVMINIGMVSGLLPVTGLPLTFISYGGSFMLASMIGVGLIINVRMRSPWETIQEGFSVGRNQMSIPQNIPDDF